MIASKDYRPNTAVAILGIGPPGSGKTRIGFALPKPGILDCDDNLRSAVRIAGDKQYWVSQGFCDDDRKEIPKPQRWEWCVTKTKEHLSHPESQTFFLDGLSNLCRWGLIYAENQLIAAGINTKKEYLAKYQAFIPLLTDYITMLRLPRKYVYVTVHQVMEKDELSGKILYRLDIPGRLADTLAGQFTDAWGAYSVEDPGPVGAKYYIRTKPSGYHVNLKTSTDLSPSIDITGMSFPSIWSILEPHLTGVPVPQPSIPLPTLNLGVVNQQNQNKTSSILVPTK